MPDVLGYPTYTGQESPYAVENIYDVPAGQDWLEWKKKMVKAKEAAANKPDRVFKIGTTLIPDDSATQGKTPDEVKKMLKMAYPEIASASHTTYEKDGTTIVEWKPRAGRKG